MGEAFQETPPGGQAGDPFHPVRSVLPQTTNRLGLIEAVRPRLKAGECLLRSEPMELLATLLDFILHPDHYLNSLTVMPGVVEYIRARRAGAAEVADELGSAGTS